MRIIAFNKYVQVTAWCSVHFMHPYVLQRFVLLHSCLWQNLNLARAERGFRRRAQLVHQAASDRWRKIGLAQGGGADRAVQVLPRGIF